MKFLLIFLLVMTPSNYSFTEIAEDSLIQNLKYDTAPAPIPLSFSEEKMASYKRDPAFDYLEEETSENWWIKLKRYLKLQYHNLLHWMFGDYSANSVLLFIIRLVPYLVIGSVVFLAIWLFNKMNPAGMFLNDSPSGKVYISEEEEIIKSKDVSLLVTGALNRQDYRMAIRYHFLLILQQLTEKGIITYEFSKTDQDYVHEIRQNTLQRQFKHLTRIYDFIWYGNFEAKREHYVKSEIEFKKMQELIRNENGQNL